ncbi:MAG TPA: YHYH protein [Candidatus Saccharimonadales bacterium]|nr:YHYH protein [Candidatus Saccharimonadales bacterium]
MQDEPQPSQTSSENQPSLPVSEKPSSRLLAGRWILPVIAILVIVVVVGGFLIWHGRGNKSLNQTAGAKTTLAKTQSSTKLASAQGLQLDPSKNYGNKYADGILPVGDGKYSTTAAQVGTPFVCQNYAKNLESSVGGAGRRGTWFVGTTQYDINKKLAVEGSVKWTSQFNDELNGTTRVITSNDLPSHTTGIFPISPSDPAYAYDKNPNTITAQSFTYDLSASPTYGSPSCIGGQVGVMLTGVALFSAFDAGGRDAGAWEVQDSCSGHPQSSGVYHYHTLSNCIKNTSVKTVIGFALDGFPITGPQISAGNILTTADLDECHGITSPIVLDGKNVTMYHYVMTQDFPYSVSCYRGTAIQPPGQGSGPQSQNQPAGQSPPPLR